MKKIEL